MPAHTHSRWRTRLHRLAMLLLVVGATAGAALGWAYHQYVVKAPGEQLSPAFIKGVIAQESPVYYRDGVTRIGVFFNDEHRSYVGFDELPRAYVAAIVAAEDDAFWSHPGIDVSHVARAAIDNLTAGHLVAGGSTLTQQTAKNLYYRPDRSLRAKLLEGLNALRLEAHYDKSEILTFYVNQFHVAGNGRGLGIGARYFFDKQVADLTVLESAFLAGLVKAPAAYDPFTGDDERRARAEDKARARTAYVLSRMVQEPAERLAGPYPVAGDVASDRAWRLRVAEVASVQAEARRLLADGFVLPFQRGVFRYESNAVLDEVDRRLGEPPFKQVLADHGIDDPATAGLKVVTTLDADAQRAALYGLWHHLTQVGVMLEGKDASAFVRADSPGPRRDPDDVPVAGAFRLARITELSGDPKQAVVDLGGQPCTVDRAAMVRAAVAVQRGAVRSPTAKVPGSAVDAFVDALGVDAVVWVSVREVRLDGEAVCDLEVRPELQGAAVVVQDGRILAMVGGNDNQNFNRATALRQMGSTWKPLVLHAALELGWRPEDALDNRRQVFPFSGTFYWPRPDHVSTDRVSLAWAGVRSENVASVWLLYHLTDRLDVAAVAELATALGLAREPAETLEAYKLRIQRAGVLPTPSRVREALYIRARSEVVAAIDRSRHPEDGLALASLGYGWGFDAARRDASPAEAASLDESWVTTESRARACTERWSKVRALLEMGYGPPAGGEPALWFRQDDRRLSVACGSAAEGFGPWSDDLLPPRLGPFQFLAPGPELPDDGDIVLDGSLHLSTVADVARAIQRQELAREVQGDEAPGLYDPELLYWHQDFRVLLGLRYVERLARRYGVRTEIQQVLSLPLGASELTLEEATMVYEGLVTGAGWRFPGRADPVVGQHAYEEPPASALLIAEIRDVDDRVLYRAEGLSEPVASVGVPEMTADILRNVVAYGTATTARGAVTLGGSPVPIGGKTGTTNDFRNAAFLGEVPAVGTPQASPLIVGVYVGYDDNRPMVSGGIKLAGASGALPAWVTIARGLAAAGRLGPIDSAPPRGGWEVAIPDGLTELAVDPSNGGLPASDGAARVWTRPAAPGALQADLARLATPDRPVRVAPRTDEAAKEGPPRRGFWQRFRPGPSIPELP